MSDILIFGIMGPVTKKYTINASAKRVWECLTDPKRIEQWTGSRCKMSEEEGAEFSLWDGDIWGKNTRVVKEKELVQDWYSGKWKSPSRVAFSLTQDGTKTILELVHTDIPDSEVRDVDSGWDDYYLEPLKLIAESI